ncbi:MAG: hypothetical protein LIP09_08065 [Bacteroidales bacterium]|nr:hypothetical protein [Bacteroidales bacterium]
MKKYDYSTAIDQLCNLPMKLIKKHLDKADKGLGVMDITLKTRCFCNEYDWKLLYNPRYDERLHIVWTDPNGKVKLQKVCLGFKPSNLGKGRVRFFYCNAAEKLVQKLYFSPYEGFYSRYAFKHWHYSDSYSGHKERLFHKFYTTSEKISKYDPTKYGEYRGKPTARAKKYVYWAQRQQFIERLMDMENQRFVESGGMEKLLKWLHEN